MVAGVALDRGRMPDRDALEAGLGGARPLWDDLAAWVEKTYGVVGEPVWYGRESGWVVRFRRSGKSLLTMLPEAGGGFRAGVVIGPSLWETVARAPLSPAVRAAWDASKPYPDGRWLGFRVVDQTVLEDVKGLVALKSPPPRRSRARRDGLHASGG